jgi:hypothetical protein
LVLGIAAVDEPTIQFPVTCPICGTEALGEYSIAVVADALLVRTDPLLLRSQCHDQRWTATEHELGQIREYLGAWLKSLPGELRKAK